MRAAQWQRWRRPAGRARGSQESWDAAQRRRRTMFMCQRCFVFLAIQRPNYAICASFFQFIHQRAFRRVTEINFGCADFFLGARRRVALHLSAGRLIFHQCSHTHSRRQACLATPDAKFNFIRTARQIALRFCWFSAKVIYFESCTLDLLCVAFRKFFAATFSPQLALLVITDMP